MTKATAKILDGKILAEKIKLDLAKKISRQKNRPGLAAILVGDNPASELYLQLKEKSCQQIGIVFHKYLCNKKCYDNISEQELIKLIKFLNQDKNINGIIVQLPLPDKYQTDKIINAINPAKDVDGFVAKNPKLIPPTIGAIIELLKATGQNLKNKKTIIIGNSDVFLTDLKKHLKTNLDIKSAKTTKKIPTDCYKYDLIIIALGRANALKKKNVKDGAIVIDVGINRVAGKTVGDVDAAVAEIAGWLSPVPGGVGPLTVACLLKNTYLLSKK
ncbi:MAG TPA: tetrahydrofolate dehydrogenase/cyclohydrolase catalytic domain-containing protein [bacterium]|nr:tetrahydrofolate dehydrogenase/cyclohydrolase catalytic domain-containing protein [bacterium]HPN81230.1 tetrahydrofolate dehydrogenase/cyclohydrolase catalytic domain-containing protein [bacterium]HPW39626.1 tetrahydrofolate dehydrogenase/cyclohydrolase catalytic domain-containing protein [bacterium]